jgi:hypothetical protein
MTVYVDDANIPYGRMIMSHMWADTEGELRAMALKIGVAQKWLQKPPAASWVHFDISLGKKKLAIAAGAVLTDKYGPVEFLARQRGDEAKLEQISAARKLRVGAAA